MKEKSIEDLAYIIKQAKENNQPRPIFFLGAGASKSGNIPTAKDIIKDILSKHSNHPTIKNLKEEEKTYSKLMECLQPYQRDKLLNDYIKNAYINVTHIYLAQLMKNGFADYILTVNFDNLMLRALALFNDFPSTYDMAILKDLTTTTFKEKSVVFLHGQHHGLWLLNTKEEMEKVNVTVPRIFDSIKNGRPWVFIGYSGNDPIFKHIENLGRFDNGLHWVTYNQNDPAKKIKNFLETPNINASIIKGYDADSFMLKLNNELGLEQPRIIDKPFTSIKEMLDNIVDIDDKEHFKVVKERFKISKRQVKEAIQQFEEGKINTTEKVKSVTEIDQLKKKIIDLVSTENYSMESIDEIEREVKSLNNYEINNLLGSVYYSWGNHLAIQIKTKDEIEAEELYNMVFQKYQKAVDLNPNDFDTYYNWGTYLGNLAETKDGKEAEELFLQSFQKFQKTINTKPDDDQAYYNWGTYLGKLAGIKDGKEAEELYHQSFQKFQKAIEFNPDYVNAYYNWGTHLGNLAKITTGKEAEELYHLSFQKFQKTIDLNPDSVGTYYNWGTNLGNLAETKDGKEAEELYLLAFQKFQKTIELNPDYADAYYNWGTNLGNLAKIKIGKEAEELYHQSFQKFQKTIELNPDYVDAYYNWGTHLGNLAETKNGKEAEDLYLLAFQKFQKTIELNENYVNAYYNWGFFLENLAKTKDRKEAEELHQLVIEKYQKVYELSGFSYNLARIYAIISDTKNAMYYLDESLKATEVMVDAVKENKAWKDYLINEDFIAILKKYEK